MKKRSKRYKEILKSFKKDPSNIKDIVPVVKKNAIAKFDESIDATFRLDNKLSKKELNIRTILNLPHGIAKKIKIAVICDDSKLNDAKNSEADIVGSDDLINEISNGKINFDKLVAAPNMMLKISKLGKILGPKGLMPNPKLGTVTNNIKDAVKNLKAGQVELKNDKDGNVLISIGKKSFPDEKIVNNYNFVLDAIKKEKPDNAKGNFILSSYVSSTMGISYKIKNNARV